MVFQSYALYPHMNVYDNMSFGLKTEKLEKNEIDKKVKDAAKTLQIEDLLERKPRQLSGGQRQRVAIARALAARPKLLLADEPTSALDSVTGREIVDLLKKLALEQSCSVLMVTHDPRILDVADRLLRMEDGKLLPSI